jgi:hypothetical protein
MAHNCGLEGWIGRDGFKWWIKRIDWKDGLEVWIGGMY